MKTMRFAVLFGGLVALAGCNGDRPYSALVYNAKVSEAALSASYNGMTSFAGFEAAATTIRNSAVFQVQNFTWPATFDHHNSLDNANVEYAHALGLTGAGETISIVDTGFLLTHDELSSKNITLPTLNPPGNGDHGTAVAAIAASDGTTGQMIGVAPGANLQLGSFNSFTSMTEATNQAASIGAIVQNNSWGYSLAATQSNYNAVFGSASGQAYINSLLNYAQNGVIVFAAANDQYQTQIDLVAGLPNLVSGLEQSFITAINGVPTHDGSGNITSVGLLSSPCFEAARFCMVADGSIVSATNSGNSDYLMWSGTSFAAPQVAGAIAVLAQAFPSLSAQELRARLLASADNGWFAHTGLVNFSDTVQHGFSDIYGHGFLDLAAALLPIGSAYVPISNSRSVDVGTPILVSRGAAGNALTHGLAQHRMVFADGMNSQFDVSAAALSAHGASYQDPISFVTQHVEMAADVPLLSRGFGSYIGGQETVGHFGGAELSFLVPDSDNAPENFGFSYRSAGENGVRFGLTGLVEAGGLLGTSLGGNVGSVDSLHGAASVEVSQMLAPGLSLALGARMGLAVPAGDGGPVRFEPTAYDEFAATLAARDLARSGDRLSFRVGLPQAVAAGQAQVNLPVALSAGGAQFSAVSLSMVPEARQLDLGMDYARPVAMGAEMVLSAAHSLNAGHVAGETDTTIGIGWQLNF